MTSGPLTHTPTLGADRPEEILAAPRIPAPRQSHEYSAQRWEGEGGLVRQLD